MCAVDALFDALVNLNDFGSPSADDVLARISDVVGHAAFSDHHSTVTFYGVANAELGAYDLLCS